MVTLRRRSTFPWQWGPDAETKADCKFEKPVPRKLQIFRRSVRRMRRNCKPESVLPASTNTAKITESDGGTKNGGGSGAIPDGVSLARDGYGRLTDEASDLYVLHYNGRVPGA